MQGYSMDRSQREEGTVNRGARYLIQCLKDSLSLFYLLFIVVTFWKLLLSFPWCYTLIHPPYSFHVSSRGSYFFDLFYKLMILVHHCPYMGNLPEWWWFLNLFSPRHLQKPQFMYLTTFWTISWGYIPSVLLAHYLSLNLVYPAPQFTDTVIGCPATQSKTLNLIFLSSLLLPLYLTSSQSPSPADFDSWIVSSLLSSFPSPQPKLHCCSPRS